MPTSFRITVDNLLEGPLLTGNEDLKRPMFGRIQDQEERFEIIEKGLLLLTKFTTDWEIQAVEWKKVLELILYGIPDGINNHHRLRSKIQLKKAKQYMTQRPRGKTWSIIQLSIKDLMEEVPICRKIGRDLIKQIYTLLKPKTLAKAIQNGIVWQDAMIERPSNYKFDAMIIGATINNGR